jgi:hypothetical protein
MVRPIIVSNPPFSGFTVRLTWRMLKPFRTKPAD